MNRPFLDYLEDILDSMRKAQQFVDGIDYDAFVQDDRTNFAVIRAIEIVGEAQGIFQAKFGRDFQRFPGAEWRG